MLWKYWKNGVLTENVCFQFLDYYKLNNMRIKSRLSEWLRCCLSYVTSLRVEKRSILQGSPTDYSDKDELKMKYCIWFLIGSGRKIISNSVFIPPWPFPKTSVWKISHLEEENNKFRWPHHQNVLNRIKWEKMAQCFSRGYENALEWCQTFMNTESLSCI